MVGAIKSNAASNSLALGTLFGFTMPRLTARLYDCLTFDPVLRCKADNDAPKSILAPFDPSRLFLMAPHLR